MAASSDRNLALGIVGFDGGIFLHALRGLSGAPGLGGIEPGELADVAVDAVGLGPRLPIQLEHGKNAKWRARLAALPIGELHAIILERPPADDHGQPRGLTSCAVDIEIDELQL